MNKEDMLDLLKKAYRCIEDAKSYLEGSYLCKLTETSCDFKDFVSWCYIRDCLLKASAGVNDAVWNLEGDWIE